MNSKLGKMMQKWSSAICGHIENRRLKCIFDRVKRATFALLERVLDVRRKCNIANRDLAMSCGKPVVIFGPSSVQNHYRFVLPRGNLDGVSLNAIGVRAIYRRTAAGARLAATFGVLERVVARVKSGSFATTTLASTCEDYASDFWSVFGAKVGCREARHRRCRSREPLPILMGHTLGNPFAGTAVGAGQGGSSFEPPCVGRQARAN
jgi:hypothetical protein